MFKINSMNYQVQYLYLNYNGVEAESSKTRNLVQIHSDCNSVKH